MVCQVDGCNRSVLARGMCKRHYRSPNRCVVDGCSEPREAQDRCRRHYSELRRSRPGAPCAVSGCDRPGVEARGFCQMHYDRQRRTGQTELVDRIGDGANRWAGDRITYGGVHRRLERYRGQANAHSCVGCSAPADNWAYNHSDPDELLNEHGHPYSPNLTRYDPMCFACHRARDRATVKPQLTVVS